MTCPSMTSWQIAIGLVYLFFEYWLGKTQKTRAASTIELAVLGILGLFALAMTLVQAFRKEKL